MHAAVCYGCKFLCFIVSSPNIDCSSCLLWLILPNITCQSHCVLDSALQVAQRESAYVCVCETGRESKRTVINLFFSKKMSADPDVVGNDQVGHKPRGGRPVHTSTQNTQQTACRPSGSLTNVRGSHLFRQAFRGGSCSLKDFWRWSYSAEWCETFDSAHKSLKLYLITFRYRLFQLKWLMNPT